MVPNRRAHRGKIPLPFHLRVTPAPASAPTVNRYGKRNLEQSPQAGQLVSGPPGIERRGTWLITSRKWQSEFIALVSNGVANFYLIEEPGKLVLVDAGAPKDWALFTQAVLGLGQGRR